MSGETEARPTGWTIDTAMAHVGRVIDDADRRYTQRFDAQERAVVVALAQVDKEFHEHISQVRLETAAALDAAEKAIAKAETATEKRFDSVNEFREQLRDQAANLMPRAEAEQRIGQLAEKLETATGQINDNVAAQERRTSDSFAGLGSRLDVIKGSSQGVAAMWGYAVGAIFLIIAVITFMNSR